MPLSNQTADFAVRVFSVAVIATVPIPQPARDR